MRHWRILFLLYLPDCLNTFSENGFSAGDSFVGGRFHAFEAIGYAEFLPFVFPHRVIGENFDTLDVVEGAQEGVEGTQRRLVVGVAGHEDMANPGLDAEVGQMASQSEDAGVVLSCESFVPCWVNVLDVKEDCVGGGQKAGDVGGETADHSGSGREPARVEAGVDAAGVGLFEEVSYSLGLQQCFAAADSDAALLAPVCAVALSAVKDSCGLPQLATFGL